MGVPLSDLIDPAAVARLRAAVDPDAPSAVDAPVETKGDDAPVAGMEHKADPGLGGAQVLSADDETGLVTALVSVTGIEDRVKDIIEPGAYTKTMAEREPIGVWSHDDKTWVARTEHAVELFPGDPFFKDVKTMDGKPWPKDAGAVKVDARFNLETPHGKAAFSDVKFFQGKTGWSIGYRATKAHRNPRTGVRHIKELDWYEYSPVMVGAASQPMTLAVKSLAGAHTVDADDPTGLVDEETLVALEPAELKAYAELRASLGLEVKDVFTGSAPAQTSSGFTPAAGLDGEAKAPERATQAKYLPCPKCHSSKVKMDAKGKALCADCGAPLTKKVQDKADDELEVKDRVRTAEGARRFGQPIGTEIVKDSVTAGSLKVGDVLHNVHLQDPKGGPSDSIDVSGKVEKVRTENGAVKVTVDGKEYNLGRGQNPVDIMRAAKPGDYTGPGRVSPVFKEHVTAIKDPKQLDTIISRLEGTGGDDAKAQLAFVKAHKASLGSGGGAGDGDGKDAETPKDTAGDHADLHGMTGMELFRESQRVKGPAGVAHLHSKDPKDKARAAAIDAEIVRRQKAGTWASEKRGDGSTGSAPAKPAAAGEPMTPEAAAAKVKDMPGGDLALAAANSKDPNLKAAAKKEQDRRDPAGAPGGSSDNVVGRGQNADGSASKWGPAPKGIDPEAWKVANDHSLDGLDPQGEDRATFQRIAEKEGVDVHDLEMAADAIKGSEPPKKRAGSDFGQWSAAHPGSPAENAPAKPAAAAKPAMSGKEILAAAKEARKNPPKDPRSPNLRPANMTDEQLVAAIANAEPGSKWHDALVAAAKSRKGSNAAARFRKDREGNASADAKVKRDQQLAALNRRRRARGQAPVLRLPGELKSLDLGSLTDDELDAYVDADPFVEFKMAHEDLNRSPKVNWVERAGQLPAYIQHIAKDIHEQQGLPLDQAIPIAISRVKKWAAGGDNVKPDTRAKAAKAVAEWEALKAKSHAKYDSVLLAQIQTKAMEEVERIEAARQVLIDAGELKADDELEDPFELDLDDDEDGVDGLEDAEEEKALVAAEEVLDMLAKARELKALVGDDAPFE